MPYKIELRHDPHSAIAPWDARIFTATGDYLVTVCEATKDAALAKAQEWLRAESAEREPTETFHADEHGNLTEPPVAASPSEPTPAPWATAPWPSRAQA